MAELVLQPFGRANLLMDGKQAVCKGEQASEQALLGLIAELINCIPDEHHLNCITSVKAP